MIFLVLATLLLAVLGHQQPHAHAGNQNAQILNYLQPWDPILLKLSVRHGE